MFVKGWVAATLTVVALLASCSSTQPSAPVGRAAQSSTPSDTPEESSSPPSPASTPLPSPVDPFEESSDGAFTGADLVRAMVTRRVARVLHEFSDSQVAQLGTMMCDVAKTGDDGSGSIDNKVSVFEARQMAKVVQEELGITQTEAVSFVGIMIGAFCPKVEI